MKTKKHNKEPEATVEQQEKATVENNENPKENSAEANCEEQLAELNDKYLRLYSDMENLRRRTAREKLELIETASEKIMKELLPVADDFERAIAANDEAEDIDSVKEGVQLVFSKFISVLFREGLKEMEALHQPFDSEKFEAIARIPAPEKKLKGKVVDVVEKGYYLNDKIIRHAKVVVGE